MSRPQDGILRLTGRRASAGAAEDDLSLLRGYRAGDPSGFERLYHRHHSQLRALCFRHLRDHAAADDAVQETFLRFLRIADRAEDGFNVCAWLHRVAVNVCMDELRRRRRVQVVDGEETAMLGVPDENREVQPEAAHEMTEARSLVVRIAHRLSRRGAAALLLREVDGLSYGAIATQLGISLGAVETLLFRARRRFAEEYLRLEGVAPTRCGLVRHVLEEVGRARIGVFERRLVSRHLRECSACRQRCDELDRPVRQVRGHRGPHGALGARPSGRASAARAAD